MMLILKSSKPSKKSWKAFTIQSCKRLTKVLHKEETVVSNIIKDTSKIMQDQVQMKLTENFYDFLLYLF
jgi:ribosomal protein S10